MDSPELFIVVGPNGSGKSSALYESEISENLLFVNPDDVARNDFADVADIDERNYLAWKECNAQRDAMLARRVTFGFETVGSHPSKLEFIDQAHKFGYIVTVMFVATEDPRINIARIANRVSKGGHGVPDEKVVSRHKRTLEMLYDYYLKTDNMSVWDNSETSPDENAHTIKKLLVKNDDETIVFEHAHEVAWFRKYLLDKF